MSLTAQQRIHLQQKQLQEDIQREVARNVEAIQARKLERELRSMRFVTSRNVESLLGVSKVRPAEKLADKENGGEIMAEQHHYLFPSDEYDAIINDDRDTATQELAAIGTFLASMTAEERMILGAQRQGALVRGFSIIGDLAKPKQEKAAEVDDDDEPDIGLQFKASKLG